METMVWEQAVSEMNAMKSSVVVFVSFIILF